MSLNNPIGGYFELETQDLGSVFHDNAFPVNTGRNALEFIIRNLSINKIHIPYYICDVTLQPIQRLGIKHQFYYLDKDFNPKVDGLLEDEALLYVNYFGILTKKTAKLSEQYSIFILDNTQAFFNRHLERTFSFYSPRKFFGVPDGGFVYLNKDISEELEHDKSYERFSHLLKRVDYGAEEGYSDFLINSESLVNQPVRKMSRLTEKLLSSIDYAKTRKIRNENFWILHDQLKSENELTDIIEGEDIYGPMVYPFMRKGNEGLRNHLIQSKIFVARYWPNVTEWIMDNKTFEIYLYDNLIPLPIDQRYGEKDMKSIIDIIISQHS